MNYTVICLARERSGQRLINYIHQRFRDSCKFKKKQQQKRDVIRLFFFHRRFSPQNYIIFGLLYYNYDLWHVLPVSNIWYFIFINGIQYLGEGIERQIARCPGAMMFIHNKMLFKFYKWLSFSFLLVDWNVKQVINIQNMRFCIWNYGIITDTLQLSMIN